MLVAVSFAVKLMSSVPILISPEVGKELESVKTTSVVESSPRLVAKVVVAAPEADPE